MTRLIRGLERVRQTEFPVNVVPAVAAMFEGLHRIKIPRIVANTQSIAQAANDSNYLLSLRLQNPGAHALLRNTCSITRLIGSSKLTSCLQSRLQN